MLEAARVINGKIATEEDVAVLFRGYGRTFSTVNDMQYDEIGGFWDDMAAIYGVENLRGLGYNWTEHTIDYVIGLKNNADMDACGLAWREIVIPDSGWREYRGATAELDKLYALIYREGRLTYEIEEFFADGACAISITRVARDYPYGYCGMPCALCSRYRANGKSACPGCSADGYYTEPCKVHHCCRDKALAHCGVCGEYPCARLGKMGDFSDLNTNGAKRRNSLDIAARGFDMWYSEYCERADMLTHALARYNNGRMKRYLCELFIQRDIDELRIIMQKAERAGGDFKQIVNDTIECKGGM